MTKPLLLQFSDRSNKPPTDGLKFVLFQVWKDNKLQGFEYGFANYAADEFEDIVNEDSKAIVLKWCTLPSPKLLL